MESPPRTRTAAAPIRWTAACWREAAPWRRPAPAPARSTGATHREPVDAHRRLTHAHGHALPFLAAGADAIVELQVVAHHADAREHVGAVADQRGALDGRAQLAVLDEI